MRALVTVLLVLVATPAVSQEAALAVANLALAGADTGVTCYGLGQGTVREVNPLLRPLSTQPAWLGGVKLAVMGTTVAVVYRQRQAHPRFARWTLVGLAIGQAIVVGWNVRQLRR